MAELNIQQKNLIQDIRRSCPDLASYSDEEILSIYNKSLDSLQLSEDERISIIASNSNQSLNHGLTLERAESPQEIRLSNEEESLLVLKLKSRINSVTDKTKEAESKNGFLGKAWSWTKNNLLDWCTDSTNDIKKAQDEELKALESGDVKKAFEQITGLEFNQDNLNKFLNNEISTKSEQALEGYKEGQEMAADFAGDIISGIASVGIYMGAVAAAPFTGGASIALGLGAAAVFGGLIKSGVKYADAKSAGREYNSFKKDMITGAFSGLLAPITGGVGGAVGRSVAVKAGVEVSKQVGKEVVKQTGKQTLKTILTNPTGYIYKGGSKLGLLKAYGTEMAVDGALGGSIDGTFREGYEEIEKDGRLNAFKLLGSFFMGAAGGAVAAPVIGGGLKGTGKLFGKTKIALNNGKTLEVTEGFGLTYKQAESNLEKGSLLFNNTPVASTKKELLKQLQEKGLDPKKEYELERFIKNLKTEEDIQKASILFSQNNRVYYVEEAFRKSKTIDDTAVIAMLWEKKLAYGNERALQCIRENPLMFNVYRDAIPVLEDRYTYILDRIIGSKLKTAEDCDMFMQIIKSNKDFGTIEALYNKGYIPKNIDDVNSTTSILNYLSHYDYRDKIDAIEKFLSLPAETRKALEKHINASKTNPHNSYYPLTFRRETFDHILKYISDDDLGPSLTQFIKNIDDFETLDMLYGSFLWNGFSEGTCDKEVIARLNRLMATDAELSLYDTEAYISKYRPKNSPEKLKFNTEQEVFDKLIETLENKAIKLKLGRSLSVEEADDFRRCIKTDYQREFVMSHLKKDMSSDELTRLIKRVDYIKNKEQTKLAEFMLDKPDDFKVLKKDYYPERVYDLFDYFKTEEDIAAFMKLYDTFPLETSPRAKVISAMFEKDTNLAKTLHLMDSLPNLEKLFNEDMFCDFILKYKSDNGRELLSEFENLVKLRPEIAEKLNNRDIMAYYFIEKIDNPEILQRVTRNIETLSKADKEFLDMIKPEAVYMGDFTLTDYLLCENINMETYNALRHLVPDDKFTKTDFIKLITSGVSTDKIQKLYAKLNNFSSTADVIEHVTPANEKFFLKLLDDPRFNDEHLVRMLRMPTFKDTKEAAIFDSRLEFYNLFAKDKSLDTEISEIIRNIDDFNLSIAKKLCSNSDFPKEHISEILYSISPENLKFAEKLCSDFDFPKEHISGVLMGIKSCNLELAEDLCARADFPKQYIGSILSRTNETKLNLSKDLCNRKDFPKECIAEVLYHTDETNISFVSKLVSKSDFPKEQIADILVDVNKYNLDLADKLCFEKNYSPTQIRQLLVAGFDDSNMAIFDNPNLEVLISKYASKEGNSKDLLQLPYWADFAYKNSISELSKEEKRKLLMTLISNKNNIVNGIGKIDEIPLIPQNQFEYANAMQKISQSLNINTTPLSKVKIDEFHAAINSLEKTLYNADLSDLSSIELKMPHNEFMANTNEIISGLSKQEQSELLDAFGFKFVEGKLQGYPKTIDVSELASLNKKYSKEIVENLNNLVAKFVDNNFITVRDNPTLNQELKTLSGLVPEIFTQIDGSSTSVSMLKSLQKIVQSADYEKLSVEDKRLVIFATLMQNSDRVSLNPKESAFDAFFIAKRFNFSDLEAQKIYGIIENSKIVQEFMNTQKRNTVRNYRGTQIIGQGRKDIFDLIAFRLKEGNLFELTKLLYSSKETPGFTRYFDKMLRDRIFDIKKHDFMLPQTGMANILSKTDLKTIQRNDMNFDVQVVKAGDIEDFYALIHTPEAGYATGGSRWSNFANFDAFKVLNDDKIICTSYVSPSKAGLVHEYHYGFIFDVANEKQHVGYSSDIFSLCKNTPDMIVEYFADKGIVANRGRGSKFEHRSNVSKNLKMFLYGQDANNPNIDQNYVARLDNIKSKLGTEPLTLGNLEKIDPEFANAYKAYLESPYSILNPHNHNEVLVSNPKISAIFTDDLEKTPIEYLQKAQAEGLPIVVFDKQ